MKVRVTVTVEIDPQAWALNYGIPLSEVRDDVKDSVAYTAQAHLDDIGVGVTR